MTGSATADQPRRRPRPQNESNDPRAHAPKASSPAIRRAGHGEASGKTGSKIAGGNHIQFIRMLAHDLRNPISGILAASQCLLEDASVFLDSPQVTLLRAIESSSDMVLHLIEDLLEVARADSGRMRLRLQLRDVTKLVEKSVVLQQPRASTRKIRVRVMRDEDVPRVEIDAPKLRWALNALLANAIRSSEPGGEIEVRIGSQRKNVFISVRHSGSLTSAGTADFRSAPSKRERRQAVALTVSTARLIVERHGGTIRVDQKLTPPGYTLTLPKSEARKPGPSLLKTASSAG